MKIQGVELTYLPLKLKTGYSIAYDNFDSADHIFIRIDCGYLQGWGCLAPDPHVTGENVREMYPLLNPALSDVLRGSDPLRRAKILDRVKQSFPNYYSVWAAVDMALWDILGKIAALPAWKLLGAYRNRIETSVTIGICDEHETLEQVQQFRSMGFRIMKIKGGIDMNADLQRLARLRREFGSAIIIRFDANQGYAHEEALQFVNLARDLHIELFEQPTKKGEPELLGMVKNHSSVPVMADESLLSLRDAFKLARKGLVDLLNIKLMKVGGISEALQVDSVAGSAGIGVMVGCMDESALAISAGLQFALSRKNIRYADLDGHLDILNDPAAQSVICKDGYLYPSDSPGLGWSGL